MISTLTITGKAMKTYNIPQNAAGFLIVQEENRNVSKQEWSTRKQLIYTDANVQVDPERFTSLGTAAYEKGSMAQQLAFEGYYVFSAVENDASSYMLAIRREDITIS